MVARHIIRLTGWWLLFLPICVGIAATETTEDRYEGFQKHWWERLRPSKPTSIEQLAYADQLKEFGHLRGASHEYRALVYTWPRSAEAPVAQLNYAGCLERRGRYREAFDAYQFLVDVYAGFFPYEEVLSRQLTIADTLATRVRTFLFFKYTTPEDAIPLFEQLIQNGPRCKGVSELQYRIGRIYETARQYDLAIDGYQKYLFMYPAGSMAEQASFGQACCYYRLAMRRANDTDMRERTMAAFEYFLDRYSRGDLAEQARVYLEEFRMIQATAYYEQARAYERSSGRTRRDKKQIQALLTAAKTAYERLICEFPNSRWVYMAQTRLNHINQQLEQ